jgi:hypothetical protein
MAGPGAGCRDTWCTALKILWLGPAVRCPNLRSSACRRRRSGANDRLTGIAGYDGLCRYALGAFERFQLAR